MKRSLFIICAAALILGSAGTAARAEEQAAPGNSSHAIILTHADTGEVLFEQNADDQMLIASTTKLMTALVVLENCVGDEKVKIKREHTLVEGSSMYLRADAEYTITELLYGLLLVSGNDAALALADYVAGGVDAFAELMNAKARELALAGSSFKNPHGLDADGHYSTARDLAVIMGSLMRDGRFVEIAGTRAKNIGEMTYVNHNKLLWNYEGTLAGKTGYTVAAGRSLVSCAERGGLKLICVTLNDPDDWDDHSALFDWGFAGYVYRNVMSPGEFTRIPVISGVKDTVGVSPSEDAKLLLKRDAELSVRIELPQFVFAGVSAGDTAGTVIVSGAEGELKRVNLCYNEGVALDPAEKLSAWERFKRSWYLANKYGPVQYGYYLL